MTSLTLIEGTKRDLPENRMNMAEELFNTYFDDIDAYLAFRSAHKAVVASRQLCHILIDNYG